MTHACTLKTFTAIALMGLAQFATAPTAYAAEDLVLKAMQDEVQRSMKLDFGSLETPYYIEYSIEDAHRIQVSATYDGILAIEKNDLRYPHVRVRIGSPKFDNTNYAGGRGAYSGRGAGYPLDDDYDNLRRSFWLTTDVAYKSALDAISRKRAALKNVSLTEDLADFSPAKQAHLLLDWKPVKLTTEAWATRVKMLSSAFLQFPELHTAAIEYTAVDGLHRMVTSEGGEIRIPEQESELKLTAAAQAKDGMMLRDTVILNSLRLDDFSSEAELKAIVAELGQTVTALAKAPRGDDYSGPVLFEGTAAPQLFAELLGRNLALSRKPVTDPGNQSGTQTSELEGRLGSRILPENFTLLDDPTLKEWKGHRLFGTTIVDEEGVEPKPLTLVENGVLKNFLLTRDPVRGFPNTNGRSRLQGPFGNTVAGLTNLIVQSKETLPHAELKNKLIEMLKQREKPFGIIVRKMDFPSSASGTEIRRLISGASRSGGSRPISLPLRTYRVYPDGHEELVRGMRFRALNVRSLKDILAAGDDINVLNYLDNGQIFALIGAASESAETSVVAPSILIDDLEMVRIEDEQPKLPVVPAPALTSSNRASSNQ